jgi:hypothetical protein
MAAAEEQLIGKAERLAARAGAAKHGLVIIAAHRVSASEGFEKWRVAVRHVKEGHGLPSVMPRAMAVVTPARYATRAAWTSTGMRW